jgi:hypothetical protein
VKKVLGIRSSSPEGDRCENENRKVKIAKSQKSKTEIEKLRISPKENDD